MVVIFALGLVVAAASALRGLWSPCGLSMLTSINPFSERGRRHRYWLTATWFLVGSTVGGCCLGAVTGIGALGLRALDLSAGLSIALAALIALTAGLLDAGALWIEMPVLRRQVNERWLDEYRGWFYGFGFGWQIGCGVATYVMTAGVFALIAFSVLTRSPLAALVLGASFGLLRGGAVFLGAGATSPGALRHLVAGLDGIEGRVRWLVISCLLGVGVVLGFAATPWLGGAIALIGAVGVIGVWFQRSAIAS